MPRRSSVSRRRFVERPRPAPARPERARSAAAEGVRVSLGRSRYAVLDRPFPAKPVPYAIVAAAVGAAAWLLGLLLASDRGRFLADREWWVQPFYLAVHLGLLRAFVGVYADNFVAGASHLDLDPAEGPARVRSALGARSVVIASLVAAPLVAFDVLWMGGDAYAGAGLAHGTEGRLGGADVVLAAVWAVEWFVNAYIGVLIVSFLVHTMHALRRHPFRDPIERVLRDRQYRPFLLMNSQGATLTVVFAAASAGYVFVAEGAASDWVGLFATAGLVLVGFVPPWLYLKSRIGKVVDAEVDRLDDVVAEAEAAVEDAPTRDGPRALSARVDTALAILRVEHLQRLHSDLGKHEAQATILKLLAPVVAALGRVVRPF